MRHREIDPAQLADIEKFEDMLAKYLAGEIPEDVFRVFRLNNGIYGTIRAHQERNYPERVSCTTMTRNPDFVAFGRAYGLHAERVETTADFAAAFERALASKTGALLELIIAPEALTPLKTLSEMRADALKEKRMKSR